MKKLFLALIVSVTFLNVAHAQNDTMYVIKAGIVVNKQSIKTEDIDSVIFYKPTITLGNIFTDSRDGNVYKTVSIGNQVWMAENLRYLPSVVGFATGSTTVPYYYVYGYNGTIVADATSTANYTTYGVLYNWPAAMNGAASSTANPSGVQGVCPIGWHLPSDSEWKQLIDYLGGDSVAGGKLKEIGTTHWLSPNDGASNETGFTALPGGYRSDGVTFDGVRTQGIWWSATEIDPTYASLYRSVYFKSSGVSRFPVKRELGFSVRCVKD